MTSIETSPVRRTPSVGELQAALEAARRGTFAAVSTIATPDVPAAAAPAPDPARRHPATASVRPPALPVDGTGSGPVVWLLGTHGASGARCLSAVLPGLRYAGRHWPEPGSQSSTVLVCRSTHRGLSAAQEYARAYRDGALAEHTRLLGLVIVADCPGRLPSPLRRMEQLVSGAVPILGRVPWVPAWRLGPPEIAAEIPKWASALAGAITAAVPSC